MAYWRRFYTDLQGDSEVVCYSAIDLVGTNYKGLEKRTCWQSLQVQVQVQVQQKRT